MKQLLLIGLFVLSAAGMELLYGGTAENPEKGDIILVITSANPESVTISDLYSYTGQYRTGTKTTHLKRGDPGDDINIEPYGTKVFYLGQCQSYTLSYMYKGVEMESDFTFDQDISNQSAAGFDSNFPGLFAVDFGYGTGGMLPPVGMPQFIGGGAGHIENGDFDWITFYDTTASEGMIERDPLGNPISPVLPDGTIVTPVYIFYIETFELDDNECPSADLTGDCRVDLEDLAVMAEQWLKDYDPC